MRYRRTLAWNARQTAIDDFYRWNRVAQHFASIYDDVYRMKTVSPSVDVSIIIPNHNYDDWVQTCAMSALAQQSDRFNIEVIVVNDRCDNDQSEAMNVLKKHANESYNTLFKFYDVDFGSVSKTRDYGIKNSSGS